MDRSTFTSVLPRCSVSSFISPPTVVSAGSSPGRALGTETGGGLRPGPRPRVWETQAMVAHRLMLCSGGRQCTLEAGGTQLPAQLPGLSPAGDRGSQGSPTLSGGGPLPAPAHLRFQSHCPHASLRAPSLPPYMVLLFHQALEAPRGAPEILFLLNFSSGIICSLLHADGGHPAGFCLCASSLLVMLLYLPRLFQLPGVTHSPLLLLNS